LLAWLVSGPPHADSKTLAAAAAVKAIRMISP
jgi:hypothetical protein